MALEQVMKEGILHVRGIPLLKVDEGQYISACYRTGTGLGEVSLVRNARVIGVQYRTSGRGGLCI